jgi:hypothetical protein
VVIGSGFEGGQRGTGGVVIKGDTIRRWAIVGLVSGIEGNCDRSSPCGCVPTCCTVVWRYRARDGRRKVGGSAENATFVSRIDFRIVRLNIVLFEGGCSCEDLCLQTYRRLLHSRCAQVFVHYEQNYASLFGQAS